MKRLTALALAVLAGAVDAEIRLAPPIDCDLDRDCFIQQYVDHDPGTGARDFRCGPLSYDTHKGTDFALRSYLQMQSGIDVLAAAPGVVQAVRDGEKDRLYGGRWGEVPSNRACGNGVVVAHADGWSTQYCHLKEGSVSVRKGDRVAQGSVLGEVGLSGRTQFPHVHMTVRKEGRVIDPFDPDGEITCGSPSRTTLWQSPLTYQPGGMLDVGFADAIPKYEDVKAGRAAKESLERDAPALVVFGYAFGGRTGDVMSLRIVGPTGPVVSENVRLTKNQAQFFRAVGRKLSRAAWTPGLYSGQVRLIRDGRLVGERKAEIRIR